MQHAWRFPVLPTRAFTCSSEVCGGILGQNFDFYGRVIVHLNSVWWYIYRHRTSPSIRDASMERLYRHRRRSALAQTHAGRRAERSAIPQEKIRVFSASRGATELPRQLSVFFHPQNARARLKTYRRNTHRLVVQVTALKTESRPRPWRRKMETEQRRRRRASIQTPDVVVMATRNEWSPANPRVLKPGLKR